MRANNQLLPIVVGTSVIVFGIKDDCQPLHIVVGTPSMYWVGSNQPSLRNEDMLGYTFINYQLPFYNKKLLT